MKVGRVYKIITGQSDECYVGSTFDKLKFRFNGHKNTYRAFKTGRGNNCSVYDLFDRYGLDKCKMILIKEYLVIDRAHLTVYETLWIKKFKSINQLEPCGGLLRKHYKKQYNEINKTTIKERCKEYRINNIDKIKEMSRNYYENNKEKLSEKKKIYRENNKEKMSERNKTYYQNNKTEINEKRKESSKIYRENNKEKINEKAKEKITCECGSIVRKEKLPRHKKTNKHIQLVAKL